MTQGTFLGRSDIPHQEGRYFSLHPSSQVLSRLEITHSLSGFPDHAAYKQIVKNPGQIKSQNYSKAKKNNHYYYYHRGTLTSTYSSRPKNNNCKK